jgi:signal transduction histidine kinase
MDDETLARATDAFYTTKAAGKGTGLGLSLCESIMVKHAGSILIDSTLGEGTAICLRFPLDTLDV